MTRIPARKTATNALFTAPETTPENDRCVVLRIPDDDEWLLLVLSLLGVGATWLNYRRSGTTRESEVAQRVREIIENWCGDVITDIRVTGETIEILRCGQSEYESLVTIPAQTDYTVTAIDCVLYQQGSQVIDLTTCRNPEDTPDNPPVPTDEIETNQAGVDGEICNAADLITAECKRRAHAILDIIEAAFQSVDAVIDIMGQVFDWVPGSWFERATNLVAEVGLTTVAVLRLMLDDIGLEDEIRCGIYNAIKCDNNGYFNAQAVRDAIRQDTLDSELMYWGAASMTDRRMYTYWRMGIQDTSALCDTCDACPGVSVCVIYNPGSIAGDGNILTGIQDDVRVRSEPDSFARRAMVDFTWDPAELITDIRVYGRNDGAGDTRTCRVIGRDAQGVTIGEVTANLPVSSVWNDQNILFTGLNWSNVSVIQVTVFANTNPSGNGFASMRDVKINCEGVV